jgi:hypothetical protein
MNMVMMKVTLMVREIKDWKWQNLNLSERYPPRNLDKQFMKPIIPERKPEIDSVKGTF